MRQQLLLIFSGLLAGTLVGLALLFSIPILSPSTTFFPHTYVAPPKQIIGFLPYWLLTHAKTDYSKDITMLSYFALRIGSTGNIIKLIRPTEAEPGWNALFSGKVDPFFVNAKKNHIALSLTLDSGDTDAINGLIANPVAHGKNLVADTLPLMHKYGFSDINLDIEYTQDASDSSRQHFTQFIKTVRQNLPKNATLTIEISSIDPIQKHLIDVAGIAPYATSIVLMAYDYHAPDSFVTGPIAPLVGAGLSSEYDVTTAVQKTLSLILPTKLILGIPLYGYEWETLGTVPRSAVIPGSGVLASNNRTETFLSSCATCSAMWDSTSVEPYISYMSSDTNTNHIIFYPNAMSTKNRIDFAAENGLAGIALWALGYEGGTILNPVEQYKH